MKTYESGRDFVEWRRLDDCGFGLWSKMKCAQKSWQLDYVIRRATSIGRQHQPIISNAKGIFKHGFKKLFKVESSFSM
jgi:hypothetical protein